MLDEEFGEGVENVGVAAVPNFEIGVRREDGVFCAGLRLGGAGLGR